MLRTFHLLAGLLATLTIATFFSATLLVELFGAHAAVTSIKHLIVFPGLLVLVPAIAATGGTGFVLSKTRAGRLLEAKMKRMPFIAANGLLVLLPAAIILDRWASQGAFDTRFYLVQAVELLVGASNLTLMGLNIRDGLKLSGRWRPNPSASVRT
jgi:hypothetical protein